jgi:ankyrin repeat protein
MGLLSDHVSLRFCGDIATIKRLRAEGVDVTKRSIGGLTAIMVAAGHGHTATVNFLKEEGASIIEKSDEGFSALHFAILHEKLSLVQCFFEEAGAIISDTTTITE